MSREKQIEEMAAITAKLLDMDCDETPFFAESNGFCELFDDCGVCKGARLLLNAGYRKQEWISVSERLPEPQKLVLCIWERGDDRRNYGFARYQRENVWYVSNEGMPRVTHWMPLPEPPKGE